jgi:hypothetical protein
MIGSSIYQNIPSWNNRTYYFLYNEENEFNRLPFNLEIGDKDSEDFRKPSILILE